MCLDTNEYNTIFGCVSAKGVRENLETTYEGTDCIKESTIYIASQEYDLFQMEKKETVT